MDVAKAKGSEVSPHSIAAVTAWVWCLFPAVVVLDASAQGVQCDRVHLLECGLSLGGEQSGHVIFADYLFTGDGLATALSVLRVMAGSGRSLADLASEMTAYPQVLMNLRVKERVDLSTVPEVAAVLQAVESRLEGNGRLLVRYSGTEPLLRVMLEGQDQAQIRRWGQEIIDAVKQHVGAA